MTERPELHLVPGGDDAEEPSPDPDHADVPVEPACPADEVEDEVEVEGRDPLLARAERIAELPLAERPAAFDGLNRAVVDELNHLDEG